MTPKTKETSLRLNLIRLLTSNPQGLTLDELSKASGIRSESELKKSLGKLYMIGTYPYSPMDYLELEFDRNRIKLLFPQNLNKTIALRSTEWLILRDSLIKESKSTLDSIKIKRIEGILKKIKSIVPFESIEEFENLKCSIRESIQLSKRIHFRYLNLKKNYEEDTNVESESRSVEPWYLWEEKSIHSPAYLIGYCMTRLSPRVFRLDQITDLILTSEVFSNPEKKTMEEAHKNFQDFLSKSKLAGNIAVIWHTRKSHFYLNQVLHLTTGNESKFIQGREFIRSECYIRNANWFLEIIMGLLPDIVLESPEPLVTELCDKLSSSLKKQIINNG